MTTVPTSHQRSNLGCVQSSPIDTELIYQAIEVGITSKLRPPDPVLTGAAPVGMKPIPVGVEPVPVSLEPPPQALSIRQTEIAIKNCFFKKDAMFVKK